MCCTQPDFLCTVHNLTFSCYVLLQPDFLCNVHSLTFCVLYIAIVISTPLPDVSSGPNTLWQSGRVSVRVDNHQTDCWSGQSLNRVAVSVLEWTVTRVAVSVLEWTVTRVAVSVLEWTVTKQSGCVSVGVDSHQTEWLCQCQNGQSPEWLCQC